MVKGVDVVRLVEGFDDRNRVCVDIYILDLSDVLIYRTPNFISLLFPFSSFVDSVL